MAAVKQTGKNGARGKPGPGRPKGSVNKTTALLKDAILQAANEAGGKGGMVAYLTRQADENPGPFMSLLGKVLPSDITSGGEALKLPTEIILRAAAHDDSNS